MEWLSAREAATDWVRRALTEELRENCGLMEERARNLVAIADHFGQPVELLIQWIHTPAPRKQWTAAEFRRFCELLARASQSNSAG